MAVGEIRQHMYLWVYIKDLPKLDMVTCTVTPNTQKAKTGKSEFKASLWSAL